MKMHDEKETHEGQGMEYHYDDSMGFDEQEEILQEQAWVKNWLSLSDEQRDAIEAETEEEAAARYDMKGSW